MNQAPIDEDIRRSFATTGPRALIKASRRHLRRPLPRTATAERVALGMIDRHGADAAREAIIHLNRMIDRGDFAARDLWACVIHVIHEQRR